MGAWGREGPKMCSRPPNGIQTFVYVLPGGEPTVFPFPEGPWLLAGSLCWPHFLPLAVPDWAALSVDQGVNGCSVLWREGRHFALGGGRGCLAGRQGAASLCSGP